MSVMNRLADIAHKSAVFFLAGTTVYYVVNISMLVNRRIELKKQGKLQEELGRLNDILEAQLAEKALHAETSTTPTPIPDNERPGNIKDL
ncbi:hypothetical protein BDB01DRAFT_752289 [Pilobolus umbonatus]|nr:hypothetical protein BDB01DRAFT_752289 [Pilobolus umbonatus]